MILLVALPLLVWDLSQDDGGFQPGGSPGQWAWEVPEAGPGDSTPCWGTRPDGRYLSEADDTLLLPEIDLEGTSYPVLVLTHWYQVRDGDAGTLEIDDGAGWTALEPLFGYPTTAGFDGASGGWIDHSFDLSGLGDTARVRLRFTSDASLVADGWYVGEVGVYDGDVTPPKVEVLTEPGDTQDLDGPYLVVLEAIDDVAVREVAVYASIDGGAFVRFPTESSTWRFRAELPGQEPDTVVEWYAEASDGEQVTRWPEVGTSSFRVFLAAPTDLRPDQDRLVGTEIDLAWDPPDSPHPVRGYQVVEEGHEERPVEADRLGAVVPVDASGEHVFRVRAEYGAGYGDFSEPLVVEVEVPELEVLEPDLAFQGDRIRVQVEGTHLYLLEGSTSVDLGPGVVVERLDVLGVDVLAAVVRVEEDAAPGLRDLSLSGPQGQATFEEVFQVIDGAERPRLLSVEPNTLVQGTAERIRVRASEPFAGEIQVDPGEALVVSSEVRTDGDTASFELYAGADVAPGPRTLVLDDGRRLWSARVSVTDYVVPPEPLCGPSRAPTWAWIPLVLVLGLGRRQRDRSASRASRASR